MSEPSHDNSIHALLARPSDSLSPRDISTLQEYLLLGASVLKECQAYEYAATIGVRDPAMGHALLEEYARENELAFPQVRNALLAQFASRPDAIVDTIDFAAAGGPTDRSREAAFRRDPGRWLPGATKSTVATFPGTGFGVVRYEGHDWLWTYAAAGYAASDLAELADAVRDGGWFSGLLVGPPGIEREVVLRDGIRLVTIDTTSQGSAA
ncbi:hypothetical protein [Methylorubrum sp. DB1722]|uniref:hypothetical protein n=1 Tax=Methylorubrum sp. DB1722 TaxID=2478916 RepID=UPI0018E35CAD|nr:hypothetical protein [Methylorubrum sp. DB1722]MBI1689502.1 hypothetical protein [Methylorubrum sp. DB1722]